MTKQQHKHSNERKQHHQRNRRPPHKDWRAWVVLGLLLAAMLAYILSNDEVIEPGGNLNEQSMPADAE